MTGINFYSTIYKEYNDIKDMGLGWWAFGKGMDLLGKGVDYAFKFFENPEYEAGKMTANATLSSAELGLSFVIPELASTKFANLGKLSKIESEIFQSEKVFTSESKILASKNKITMTAEKTTEEKSLNFCSSNIGKDWSFLKLSERHFPNSVTMPKTTGNTMFTISKNEAMKDLKEIRLLGDKIREGEYFYPSSGRVYGIDNISIHPISGNLGTIDISNAEYNILILAKKEGYEKAVN
jgi:hypothetical protein